MAHSKLGLTLSIQQPWAWLIAHGYKDVENRTWPTRVRGWVHIHAGQKFDFDGYGWVLLEFPEIKLPAPKDLPRGGIVGHARIIDCVQHSTSRWFFGPYGFTLADAEPLEFVPCRGRLSFFVPEVPHGS